MSELQETDKVMRVFAVIVAASILVIGLGIRPIHYTPTFLGILGVGLIICAVLIGGIIVLLATFIGALS